MTTVITSFLRASAAALAGFMRATALPYSLGARNGPPQAAAAPPPPPPAGATGRGRGGGLQFTEPAPLDFNDHDGYVSMFDGKTLGGWDGNPKFWRVEDGAMVGESTPERPSGNNYIAYRRMEAKDFTLKFEIKVEGTDGSGLQYRGRTCIPWLANIPANVTAFNGPVNLDWMITGRRRLPAESRLHRAVLIREHADADSRLARSGDRRIRREEQAAHGGDRRA